MRIKPLFKNKYLRLLALLLACFWHSISQWTIYLIHQPDIILNLHAVLILLTYSVIIGALLVPMLFEDRLAHLCILSDKQDKLIDEYSSLTERMVKGYIHISVVKDEVMKMRPPLKTNGQLLIDFHKVIRLLTTHEDK